MPSFLCAAVVVHVALRCQQDRIVEVPRVAAKSAHVNLAQDVVAMQACGVPMAAAGALPAHRLDPLGATGL